MRGKFRICHGPAPFFPSLVARVRRFIPGERTDLDFSHLEQLRNRLEKTAPAPGSFGYTRTDTCSESIPSYSGRQADSFLRRCLTAVRKDIDDILRADSWDDL